MLRTRIIPCLLLKERGLVKTTRFRDPRYIGDPINAVRIFNDKEVYELILLDIEASRYAREPDYKHLEEIGSEAFMPIAYGGGIATQAQARRVIATGVEKVVVNTGALHDLDLIHAMADCLGSQSTVLAVNVKRSANGQYLIHNSAINQQVQRDLLPYVSQGVRSGAGEVFINDVDRDGTRLGYDLALIQTIAANVTVPVVACGGAGTLQHMVEAASMGASGIAAGSLFVYVGKRDAVLINYPHYSTLIRLFSQLGS